MGAGARRRVVPLALVLFTRVAPTAAQAPAVVPPELRVGTLDATHTVDGRLDEPGWATADFIDAFTQADPREGAPASARTTVRVLAGPKALVIGIDCDQPADVGIVSFNVRRDATLTQEDHVRIVLGPFMDGRSGYVFAVNPSGARYDGIVNPGGESDNAEWDGIWDAATVTREGGWSAEVWIPFLTLSFKPELRTWHFNVQRRIQGLLETDRWASAARQYQVTQTSRAGLLTQLPPIDLGRGLSVRPAVTTGGGLPAPSADVDGIDTATKVVILANGVLGRPCTISDVKIEGIRGVTKARIEAARKNGQTVKLIARIAKELHDAGVSVQVGAHGQREGLGAHWELWMFVQGGMTPLEALKAGTWNGAKYLGLDSEIGSLEPGKLADLIVVDGNPVADIRQSEKVLYTVVNGRLYDAATMNELGNHPKERAKYWWEKE